MLVRLTTRLLARGFVRAKKLFENTGGEKK
jgi:hypothetical protein